MFGIQNITEGGDSIENAIRKIEPPNEAPENPWLHVLAFVTRNRNAGPFTVDGRMLYNPVRSLASVREHGEFRIVLVESFPDILGAKRFGQPAYPPLSQT